MVFLALNEISNNIGNSDCMVDRMDSKGNAYLLKGMQCVSVFFLRL